MKTITIVGFGRFGKTLYRLLKDRFKIRIFDNSQDAFKGFKLDTSAKMLDTVGEIFEHCSTQELDTIFYCVPISAFARVIEHHKKYFTEKHLIVDVLSVKTHPKRVLSSVLKDTKLEALLTHPMFGPDSSRDGFEDLPIVIDRFKSSRQTYDFWKKTFSTLGLKVVEMSAEKHDRLAANSQGLTHFVGRLLSEVKMEPTPIDTQGARKLREIRVQTCNDSFQLFRDLQTYNPYARQMRQKFSKAVSRLNQKLLTKPKKPKVPVFGIQGGRGSFNEQAIHTYLKRHKIKKYKIKYLYTTERVLSALERGGITFGQFAIHNSIGGIVQETVQAIAKHKFKIQEEFAIKICHFLMKSPNSKKSDITTIMTHPQVLKQCQSTLAKRHPKLKKTSGKGKLIDHAMVAREMAAGKVPKNVAVMGPEILAEIYNLDIIDENLQDNEENFTSFLVVGR